MKTYFIDEAKIYVEGGRGGNGCVSFRREKYVPRGGPDGGDGGRGGHVILVGSSSVRTLLDYHYKRHYKAQDGGHGKGKFQNGRDGDDCRLYVPLGTVVYNEEGQVLGEILKEGQELIVARGGRGGRGNAAFVNSVRQAPSIRELGEPGEARWIRLELRLLADVGIVGFPNAGKSTFISRVSKARPKIADYPFTTLNPHLGTVRLSDGRTFVICDLPGIIEGASEGRGLGLKFLKHISRAAVILIMLDLADPLREPLKAYETLLKELEKYEPGLLSRVKVVAGNKIDLSEARAKVEQIKGYFKEKGIPFYPISAVTGEGIEPLLYKLAEEVEKHAREIVEREPDIVVPEKDEIEVIRVDESVFEVKGRRVERVVAMTDFDNEEAVLNLQKKLKRMGIEEKLKEAGASYGDTVIIGKVTFDFLPEEDENGKN
jgi:GTP-binding protein